MIALAAVFVHSFAGAQQLDLPDDVRDVVFAVRPFAPDPHYYANFGYWCADPERKLYSVGGRLCRLDLRTGEVTTLLDDPQGGVRDPQVHYDGRRILFSYRPGGTEHYNLYEINPNGGGLRQLTDGPFDDIEPTYLPGGDIVFCSSRCNRWIGCWFVSSAILYRCDPDGGNMRVLSSSPFTENTPAVLPDGRLLYTRWEYVDRSQLCYHHLWTMNPDGTAPMTFFGNMHPTGRPHLIQKRGEGRVVHYSNVPTSETQVMIDARPIPGTGKVVAIFSPGHGRREHVGRVTIIDPRAGPDHRPFARRITPHPAWRDPYPLSADRFLLARDRGLYLMDDKGATRLLHSLADAPRNMMLHEPVPVQPRKREPNVPARKDMAEATGRLILADVTRGRNMDGVKPGEIKKLLVLEQLPVPFHTSPGMDRISAWGTFTLTRILGTVPVAEDGSAYMEVPPLRSLFFVALDEDDLSVKRMQSYVTVQPGEVTSCVGCHEPRTESPANPGREALQALSRPPSRIEPIPGVPEVIDFRRDVQPILDKHCVRCHGPEKRSGGVYLAGRPGAAMPPAYFSLTRLQGEVSDGRNAHGNRAPRSIGSSASQLMKRIGGGHHGVQVIAEEAKMIRLWIDSSATANGTYAVMSGGRPDRPNPNYIREMKRYGILPQDFDPETDPINSFETDKAYWRSLWHQPDER